ncbi:MAG: hypothetical protein IPN86_22565 [Saprospiraceae bacterium]|jgi:hypothetical protein|nr:hypothetical protein [Saprospiraceae bacterium]
MIAISENTIDAYIERYESEANYIEDLKTLSENQPGLMAFIDQENYTLLTNDEIALMEYLTTIIYFSSQSQVATLLKIMAKELEKAEELNWDIFNASTNKNFAKILDTYFENYQQEDLLALIEDSIQQDDDSTVTAVGREIIFVACKSIIDTLHELN